MYPDPSPPATPHAPLMILSDVKALLGIGTGDVTYDLQLTFALNVVSDMIRSYTGRVLSFGPFIDQFHPPQTLVHEGGRSFLSLSEYPVKMVSAFTIDGLPASLDLAVLHRRIGILWPVGVSPTALLQVEYEAGYEPLPYDLQSVFIDLVRRQLVALGVDLTTVSQTVPDAAPVRGVSVGALRVDYGVSVTAGGVSASSLSPLSATVLEEYTQTLNLYRSSRSWVAVPA